MSRAGVALPRYRAVLLDAGETLLSPRDSFGAVYARVFATLGVRRAASEFDAALRSARAEMERRIPRGADRYRSVPGGENGYWLEWVRGTLRSLEFPPGDGSLASRALPLLRRAFLTADAWHVWPDVRPALGELRRFGLGIAVVSNWDSKLPRLLDRLGLRERIDVLSVSSLEGTEKPDPALFRVALERLGVAPWDALHVGDVPDVDVDGAVAAGVDAALVDRRSRPHPADGALRDLRALPRLAWEGAADGVRVRSGSRRP